MLNHSSGSVGINSDILMPTRFTSSAIKKSSGGAAFRCIDPCCWVGCSLCRSAACCMCRRCCSNCCLSLSNCVPFFLKTRLLLRWLLRSYLFVVCNHHNHSLCQSLSTIHFSTVVTRKRKIKFKVPQWCPGEAKMIYCKIIEGSSLKQKFIISQALTF